MSKARVGACGRSNNRAAPASRWSCRRRPCPPPPGLLSAWPCESNLPGGSPWPGTWQNGRARSSGQSVFPHHFNQAAWRRRAQPCRGPQGPRWLVIRPIGRHGRTKLDRWSFRQKRLRGLGALGPRIRVRRRLAVGFGRRREWRAGRDRARRQSRPALRRALDRRVRVEQVGEALARIVDAHLHDGGGRAWQFAAAIDLAQRR